MKRNLSILLVVVVVGIVWYLSRPAVPAIKSAAPLTEFHQAIERGRPIFIMFTKTGCSSCVAMYPIVQTLKDEFEDRMTMIVADIGDDQGWELSREFDFRAVPHFIVIGNQGGQDTYTGHTTAEQLRGMIEAALAWAP